MGCEEFDPARFKGEFKIAALDYEMFVVIPKLMARLRETAPGVRIQVMQYDPHIGLLSSFNNGIDLILYSTDDAPEGIFKQKLFSDNYAIVMSNTHPLAKKEINIKAYCMLKHAIVSGDGIKPTDIDKALKQLKCKRDVVLSVPHFALAPKIVANSDFVMTMPSKLIKYIGETENICLKKLPLTMVDFFIEQFWHELNHYDLAHRWLRQQVKEVVDGL
ncbi:LysR substrate-binding domain-containing protein [Zooshikella harenae]|nr:LysR substrate-binding domain-containing protein [Zooshikella harenae]